MQPTEERFEIAVYRSDGSPMPAADLVDAMILDAVEQTPAFAHKPEAATGRVRLPVPDGAFAVSLPMAVHGFGHVWVCADNEGAGYQPGEAAGRTLDFLLEAAASRAAAVAAAEARFGALGTKPSSDYRQRMAQAQNLLADARAQEVDGPARAKLATASLAESLHAGEMLVVEHARSRIAASPKREGFLFGCNGFDYPRHGEPYAELFNELFNFVTLPFFRSGIEPQEGKRDFSRVEKILEWTTRDGLENYGHPLIWFHRASVPEWMRGRSYDEVAATHRDYILDSVGRFHDRIPLWDVINEAHDWANDFGFSTDQLVEMTRLAADVTREADPKAIRLVNSCCTWSEFVARGCTYSGQLGRPARNVLQYLRDCLAAGVDFEIVGVQMYYPVRDLFEIDRQLDRFCALGKPVHITELGVSSSIEKPAKDDPIGHIHGGPFWHGRPWSEAEQADWIEAYYTMCYAKPEIEAITWFDFCDPAFMHHSGLVDERLRPKESYHRLKRLIAGWG